MTDKHVYSVLSVSVAILKTFPATLQVSAYGQTRTGGYTHVRLEPRVYVAPPADGIYEFDFVATPPSGIATTVITPVTATCAHPAHAGIKGVRVYAETNQIEKLITQPIISTDKDAVRSLPATARGYSDKYDLREAMQDAIRQLPDQSAGEVDHLSHYTVLRMGAEVGGIAGFNRLYVDLGE
jgi:hypothetical protein